MSEVRVGERVHGYDPDYEESFEGEVLEVKETRSGLEAFVRNELDGPFKDAIVALPIDRWRHEADR